MTEPAEGGCCRCCTSFIFTSGFTALFLWLSLRTSAPVCSIEQFDAFALNKSSNTRTNHTIWYDLKLNNKNKDKGIYYDTVNLSFYYKPNISFPIGNGTFVAFYQGHEKSTHRYGNFEPRRVNWSIANAAVATNGSAVFRVELATAVRYKLIFWKTKRHHLFLGADLPVDDNGSMVRKKKNKGIKLTSGATKIIKDFFGFGGILGILVSVHFL